MHTRNKKFDNAVKAFGLQNHGFMSHFVSMNLCNSVGAPKYTMPLL